MQTAFNIFVGVFVPVATALVVYLFQREGERGTTQCALLAAISTLIDVIDAHSKWWLRQQAPRPTLIPFATPVYDSQVAKIGMLPSRSVPDIVAFFSYVKFLNSLQAVRITYGADEEIFAKTYSGTLNNCLKTFAPRFKKAFTSAKILPLPIANET